jgi:MFS family permease
LRQWLQETPVFAEMQARQQLAADIPLKLVLRDHRRALVVSMLLTWLLSAAIVTVTLMTPALLQKQFHIATAATLDANGAATLGLIIGCVAAGTLADRLGVRLVLVLGSILLAAAYLLLFRVLAPHPAALLPLYALTGLLVGVVGTVPLVMVKAFPPAVRFSGLSFAYNVAYAISGGLTPIIVTLLIRASPMGPPIYLALVCVVGAVTAAFVRDKQAG